jgi:hypothetical protein
MAVKMVVKTTIERFESHVTLLDGQLKEQVYTCSSSSIDEIHAMSYFSLRWSRPIERRVVAVKEPRRKS